MSKDPLVTVIIPAYNAEMHLRESIESILAQDFTDFELLVIDDASSDSTLEIASEFESLDKRVRVVQNSVNLGPGGTRAHGVDLARGTFLAWLDADDVALPDRLTKQVAFMDKHPKVGVVGGSVQFFDSKGPKKVRSYDLDDASLRRKIFRQNPVANPATLFRAEVFTEVGNYSDLRQSEDLEILFRLGTKYEFANLADVVTRYRQLDNSMTQSSLKQMERQTLALRKQYSKSPAYEYRVADRCFNLVQGLTIWMPVKLRMRIFSVIRGDA